MYRPSKKLKIRDTVSLAGWLFADLLLGLAMLFLIINMSKPDLYDTGLITPTSTSTPSLMPLSTVKVLIKTSTIVSDTTQTITPTIKPTANKTPVPKVTETSSIGLDLRPGKVSISLDSRKLLNNNMSELELLQNQIITKFSQYQNRRVGLVITLGYHDNVADGVKLAKKGNEYILKNFPKIFSGAIMKPFWYSPDYAHPEGTITYEFYFFTSLTPP